MLQGDLYRDKSRWPSSVVICSHCADSSAVAKARSRRAVVPQTTEYQERPHIISFDSVFRQGQVINNPPAMNWSDKRITINKIQDLANSFTGGLLERVMFLQLINDADNC